MPRCGDMAFFDFSVTDELVGDIANVWVVRNDSSDLAGRHVYNLKKAEHKRIFWPDLQVKGKADGTFYGGRKVDTRGLEKRSYKDRMAAQKFSLNIYVRDKHKKSDNTIDIEALPDKYEGPISSGMVCDYEMVQQVTEQNPFNGNTYQTIRRAFTAVAGGGTSVNVGKYHLQFKDGVLYIIVKIDFYVDGGPDIDDAKFKYIKERIENFWNATGVGYAQWDYHRDNCERVEACDCAVGWNEKGDFYAAGCCKAPVRVWIERGADNLVEMKYLTAAEWQGVLNTGGLTGVSAARRAELRANTCKFTYPETRANVYAHEIGHMMGFPDEYWGGHTAQGAIDAAGYNVPGAAWPIDNDSIMGQGLNRTMERHFVNWKDWINQIDGTFEPLKRER